MGAKKSESRRLKTLNEVKDRIILSPMEKRVLLSISGRIRTKFRPKLMISLKNKGLLSDKNELTEAGLKAVAGIIYSNEFQKDASDSVYERLFR